jgi:asparagine synthase (glutamine-hydrolysing)
MFAFALWDDQQRKLYLVRDRLGVKPLVFALRGRTIAFASTVRALRVAGFVSRLNECAILDFLEMGYVTDNHAIYHGAFKVPAATIVEWSDGVLSQREYWEPPLVSPSPTLSFQEALEQTEQLFLEAVKIRLHADVPVGALLSGGIDSALVCWAVMKHGQDLTAYTIGVPGDPWDETAAARTTAQAIGIEHRVLDMSIQDIPQGEELVSAYAEPFACASALGMLRVSKAIASSVKVLLTGDGGDDVFLGYPRHRHLWLAGRLAETVPTALTRCYIPLRSILPRLGVLRRAAALLDYASGDLRAFAGDPCGFGVYNTSRMLGSRLKDLTPNPREILLARNGTNRLLTSFLPFERKTRFVGEYLSKVDGATMHYGLEARSPFLDQYLWEFTAALPFDLRLHGGRLKALLRELVRRRISKNVAWRRKRGFGIPVQRWLVGRWRSVAETVWRESLLDEEGWICAQSVLTQLELAAHKGWAPHQLWYLFVFELWRRYEQCNTV